jgi:kynurenine formamidase
VNAPVAERFRFDRATPLALELDFDGAQPRHFGAPAARSSPLVVGGFTGDVARGDGCNCRSITLVPHCNGTHTESVGHLTLAQPLLHRIVPVAPIPALLLSVATASAPLAGEDSLPAPRAGDQLLTRAALRAAWPQSLPFAPRALLLRTRAHADGHDKANPPYLSRQATEEIVARGIEHLVLDLPSADRTEDGGVLCAHHLFFGLPAGSVQLGDATRAHCTITELARFPDGLADGPCALLLQLPAFSGDAVPSRPIHLEIQGA